MQLGLQFAIISKVPQGLGVEVGVGWGWVHRESVLGVPRAAHGAQQSAQTRGERALSEQISRRSWAWNRRPPTAAARRGHRKEALSSGTDLRSGGGGRIRARLYKPRAAARAGLGCSGGVGGARGAADAACEDREGRGRRREEQKQVRGAPAHLATLLAPAGLRRRARAAAAAGPRRPRR